ncbi:MAG: hypothetical protein HQM10_02965 [Candidatus Riflebacteria bacterium]|nr:hypothetical protein [Candidatus Riflebacteria bacterium]
MKKTLLLGLAIVFCVASTGWCEQVKNRNYKANTLFTGIVDILNKPENFADKYVSLKGILVNIAASSSDEDFYLFDDSKSSSIRCASIPNRNDFSRSNEGKEVTILGKIIIEKGLCPYISVEEITVIDDLIPQMVSVSQILFDPLGTKGKRIQILGVLVKGNDAKGRRFYLLADPTGAISLEKLPKLFPKGSILNISGVVSNDADGLPILTDIEIIPEN